MNPEEDGTGIWSMVCFGLSGIVVLLDRGRPQRWQTEKRYQRELREDGGADGHGTTNYLSYGNQKSRESGSFLFYLKISLGFAGGPVSAGDVCHGLMTHGTINVSQGSWLSFGAGCANCVSALPRSGTRPKRRSVRIVAPVSDRGSIVLRRGPCVVRFAAGSRTARIKSSELRSFLFSLGSVWKLAEIVDRSS